MDIFLLGEKNIERQYNILSQKVIINNPEKSKDRWKKFLADEIRKIYNEQKGNIPKGVENSEKFLSKINQMGIERCIRIVEDRKQKRLQEINANSNQPNIDALKYNREKQLYGNRKMTVSPRPNYTQNKGGRMDDKFSGDLNSSSYMGPVTHLHH